MSSSARSPRFVILFGFGLLLTLVSFSLFLADSYREYVSSVVLLSPGQTSLFFTLDVVLIMILYSIVLVVLSIALLYSWRGYHALAPPKISQKEQLAELRKKSPFFNKS